MKQQDIEELTAVIQRNCHISDARYAADYGLCSYLLKMREYYRWEKRLGFNERLAPEGVGEWLTQRERLWEELAETEFAPVPVAGRHYDPFDSAGINCALGSCGLVYNGGVGRRAQAHFFLGRLERREVMDGCEVYIAGDELARDLSAPPAMYGGGAIFLRRQSLRRLLWEKLENWRWSRADSPLGRAFAEYDFDNDLDGALERMTESELTTAFHHELGEYLVGEELGPVWNDLLLALSGTPAERMLRAVRDNWADCRVTLPALLKERRVASLHFLVGNMEAMNKEIFPSLRVAYQECIQGGRWSPLDELTQKGVEHWAGLARELIQAYQESPHEAAQVLRELVERNYL